MNVRTCTCTCRTDQHVIRSKLNFTFVGLLFVKVIINIRYSTYIKTYYTVHFTLKSNDNDLLVCFCMLYTCPALACESISVV